MTPKKSILKKLDKNERVTIVTAPLEQYSGFPEFIDDLYQNADYPFELIVIEGNSPDNIKAALERQRKYYQNIKIIYSLAVPLAGAAFNLAIPHVRTNLVLFLANNANLKKGWLKSITNQFANRPSDKAYINISCQKKTGDSLSLELRDDQIQSICPCGFMITMSALKTIGEFNDSLSLPALGVDYGMRAKQKEVIELNNPIELLESIDSQSITKKQDMELFDLQWNKDRLATSIQYLEKTWGLQLDKARLLSQTEPLLPQKQQAKTPVLQMQASLQSAFHSARMNIKYLIHSFTSL